jgi:hypothetical protein
MSMTKTAPKKTAKPRAKKTAAPVLVAFKGFDKDWKCRGFQYEVGKSYTHKGDVVACHSGFHSCEMPLDALTYYQGGRYALVEVSGELSRQSNGDSKVASGAIAIKAELKIPDLIAYAVKWIIERAKGNTATGDSGHAAATGYSGHAAATGDYGHAAATGDYGHAAATGDSGHAAAPGHSGHAAATGDSGHAAATGNYGHAAATGHSGHAAATGHYGHAAATGHSGHAAATGHYGHAAATGYSGHAAATGANAAAFAGYSGRAKAGATGAFVIAWYDEAAERCRLIVGTPGENGIKADTFYCVNRKGELEEVK